MFLRRPPWKKKKEKQWQVVLPFIIMKSDVQSEYLKE